MQRMAVGMVRRFVRAVAVLLIAAGLIVALVGAVETLALPSPAPSTPSSQGATTFTADLAGAVRAGDTASLVAWLHPGVIAVYGLKACQDKLAGIKDPTVAFDVQSVRGPGVWRWSAGSHSFLASSAFELRARQTLNGAASDTVIHVAYAAGHWRWFTEC